MRTFPLVECDEMIIRNEKGRKQLRIRVLKIMRVEDFSLEYDIVLK